MADAAGNAGSSTTDSNNYAIESTVPPTGSDVAVQTAEDTAYTFAVADFGFADADGHTLAAVRIDTLPADGQLTLRGVAVAANSIVQAGDVGSLIFTPTANANGVAQARFTFSVQDSSGAFDTAPNTVSINVTTANDAPVVARRQRHHRRGHARHHRRAGQRP